MRHVRVPCVCARVLCYAHVFRAHVSVSGMCLWVNMREYINFAAVYRTCVSSIDRSQIKGDPYLAEPKSRLVCNRAGKTRAAAHAP